jgi:hypothetical protein
LGRERERERERKNYENILKNGRTESNKKKSL